MVVDKLERSEMELGRFIMVYVGDDESFVKSLEVKEERLCLRVIDLM